MGGNMAGDGVEMCETSLGGTLGTVISSGRAPGKPPEMITSVFSKEIIDPEKYIIHIDHLLVANINWD